MVEITKSFIHLPVHNRDKNDKIVTISVSKSKQIKALYSVNRKIILTLLFDKKRWTLKKAQDWKKSHVSVIEATLVFAGADAKDFVYSGEPTKDYIHSVTFVSKFGLKIKF